METYTTRMFDHSLIAEQQVDGSFVVRIDGTKPTRLVDGSGNAKKFWEIQEAKKELHALAHWHLQGINYCDGGDHPLCREFGNG